MSATQLQLYKSPRKQIYILSISFFFVVVGIYLLQSTFASVLMAWLCILIFSIGILIGLLQLLERQPQIIISDVGIFDRATHPDFINWKVIQEAHPLQAAGQEFVSLMVAEDFVSSIRGKKPGKAVNSSHAAVGQQLHLSLEQLPVNAGRMADFVQAILAHAPEARAEAARRALPAFQDSISEAGFKIQTSPTP